MDKTKSMKNYYTIAVYGDGVHYPETMLLDTRVVYCKEKGIKNTSMYHFVVDCVAYNKDCIKIFKGII